MGRKIQELKTYTNFHPSKSNNKTMNIQFLAYQIKYKKIRIINTDRRARKQTHILLARLMEGNLVICVKSLKNINKHL